MIMNVKDLVIGMELQPMGFAGRDKEPRVGGQWSQKWDIMKPIDCNMERSRVICSEAATEEQAGLKASRRLCKADGGTGDMKRRRVEGRELTKSGKRGIVMDKAVEELGGEPGMMGKTDVGV